MGWKNHREKLLFLLQKTTLSLPQDEDHGTITFLRTRYLGISRQSWMVLIRKHLGKSTRSFVVKNGENKINMTNKTLFICKYEYSIVQKVSEIPTHYTDHELSSINRIDKKTIKVKKSKKKTKKDKMTKKAIKDKKAKKNKKKAKNIKIPKILLNANYHTYLGSRICKDSPN